MKIGSIGEAEFAPVEQEGAQKVSLAWLLDAKAGAPTFAMRLFRIDSSGCTPRHAHAWEHEVYVIGGSGKLWVGGQWTPLGEGSFVLVLPGEEHQFACSENETMEFLCMIPHSRQA